MPNPLRADAIEAMAIAAYGGDWATASAWIKSGLLFDAAAALDALLAFLRERGMVVVVNPDGGVLVDMCAAFWRIKNGHHFHGDPAPTDTSDAAAMTAAIAAAGDGLGGE